MTDEIVKRPGAEVTTFAGATDFDTAQRMAKALSSSTLVPKEYQGSLPNVLIAMEVSNRVGASVFAVMQSLDIIHGRPSWRASALIAMVNASGKFTPLRFRWVGKRGAMDWGCYAYAKSLVDQEECIGETITMQLAKDEGWLGKSGSKWKTMPGQMLMYRAAAFWARIYCPELSLGMQTAEEAIDVHAVTIPQHIANGDTKALEAALLADQVSPPPDGEMEKASLKRGAGVVDADPCELLPEEQEELGL